MKGKMVSFSVCMCLLHIFETKSNISGKGLGEFQMEMGRGKGLGGEDRGVF